MTRCGVRPALRAPERRIGPRPEVRDAVPPRGPCPRGVAASGAGSVAGCSNAARRTHPADWRFPFYMGFTHYFSLGDAVAGGRAMAEAARLPGSPAYLPGLASRMLSEAREPEAALRLLEPIVRQESDPARRAVLERRIREVTVERDLQALERAVETYRERTGAAPARVCRISSARGSWRESRRSPTGEDTSWSRGEGAQRPGSATAAGVPEEMTDMGPDSRHRGAVEVVPHGFLAQAGPRPVRSLLRGARERDRRVPRPQRRGEDDHDQDPEPPRVSGCGEGDPVRRAGPGRRRRSAAASASCRSSRTSTNT